MPAKGCCAGGSNSRRIEGGAEIVSKKRVSGVRAEHDLNDPSLDMVFGVRFGCSTCKEHPAVADDRENVDGVTADDELIRGFFEQLYKHSLRFTSAQAVDRCRLS